MRTRIIIKMLFYFEFPKPGCKSYSIGFNFIKSVLRNTHRQTERTYGKPTEIRLRFGFEIIDWERISFTPGNLASR